MSADIVEIMGYDEVKAVLRSFGATDLHVYRIFQHLQSGGCAVRVGASRMLIEVENSAHYRVTLL